MQVTRKKTKKVMVGSVEIGGDAPISIQSMCNTPTENIKATVGQILALEQAGCEIARVAVPHMEAAKALEQIKAQIHIPLVADIHFDYNLAIASAPHVDKLRINPGNIGEEKNVAAVIETCKKYKLPIRIGVNSGSIEKEILEKHGRTPDGMVESAMSHVKILEKHNFDNIILSLKASTVNETISAYQLISEKVDYPLHVGVTEAGTAFAGTIKSSIGIGALLAQGIGDTIRVSLTDDPVKEIGVAKEILKSLELRQGVNITSCPTCGRTQIDLIKLTKEVEEATKDIQRPINVAVMGCVVNGPGEASHADYGVAGGDGFGILFKKGKTIKQVNEAQIVPELIKLIKEDA